MPKDPNTWIIYMDGFSCQLWSCVGVVLSGLNDEMSELILSFKFTTSNNQDEYKAKY